jgi:hypothetical protein
MRLPLVLLASLGLGATACAPMYGDVAVEAPTPVVVAGPPGSAVYVAAPGVEVITGWDQPMYFVDNGYWYWYEGRWMTYWGGSWVWATPPRALVGIREPWRHRWAPGTTTRDHRTTRHSYPSVRDHRSRSLPPAPTTSPRSSGSRSSGSHGGGSVRDHRRR